MTAWEWLEPLMSTADVALDKLPLASVDQIAAAERDALDRLGITAADPVQLEAFMVGLGYALGRIGFVMAAGGQCRSIEAVRMAVVAEFVRATALVPREARRG